MTSQKQERPFTIKRFLQCFGTAKTEGGVHIYILILFFMMFLIVLFRVLLDTQRMGITKDMVEDALMTSMVSACVYNKEEKNASGAIVIYRKLTPLGSEMFEFEGGRAHLNKVPINIFSMPEMLSPSGDAYLQKSWEIFLKNLKKNLRLNDDMTANISGLSDKVKVEEYAVYNKFYNLDADRKQKDFKFVKYSYYPETDRWSAYEYTPNTYPTTYNSLTKSNYKIQETSISVKISLNVVGGTATAFANKLGKTQNDLNVPVTYQRVVDVKLSEWN